MKAEYSIFIRGNLVASVEGVEFAYEVWAKVLELAKLLGVHASMVANEDLEMVEYVPEEDFDNEPDDIDDDMGYDPYAGCMTWDC